MSLSIGIIGLPNVGKSTLFNALLKKQVALSANYPFATIEPNVGVVKVPDERLSMLAEVVKNDYEGTPEAKGREVPRKIVPAVVKFVDIAGLVEGASEGQGLGNKFLNHIREVDALLHVLRAFEDENIARAGSVNPKEDREVIETELILADLQFVEKRMSDVNSAARSGNKDDIKRQNIYRRIQENLSKGVLASEIILKEDESELIKDLNLLTLKPVIYVFNYSENSIIKANKDIMSKNSIHLSAKLDSEISSLSKEEQEEYLEELSISSAGLDTVIKKGYDILGLETYFTAGPKEVHAWTIKKGSKAPQAAGRIHSDFERGFISAEVISCDELVKVGSWKKAKEKGLIRVEGKNYTFKDGDVANFNFSV